ncbi:MAG: cyclase family protein [Chloroflexi bacterium]|nr:cyclase family protein [Chloroflexota bacterium]
MSERLFSEEITNGVVYDLGQPFHPGMPRSSEAMPFLFWVTKKHSDKTLPDGFSASVEMFTSTSHMGTHIDALGHVSLNGKLFGGELASANQDRETGLKKLGIDAVPPLVTRGVLLDVAGLKQVEVLPPAYEITAADLEQAATAAGKTINPGDAVFIRTGWSRYWADSSQYHSSAGCPGPARQGAEWLANKGIRLTGSDTPMYEKGDRRPGLFHPVHLLLLVERGIHIVESMNLEPLVQASVSSFVSVTIPLAIVGASGSPVRPIAIK